MASFPSLGYPQTRQVDVEDDYFGVKIADPYRWLEDPDSLDTAAWVQQENEITMNFFNAECTYREPLRQRLQEVYDYPKYSSFFHRGEKYFYYKKAGLQNQSVLYMVDSVRSPESDAKVLLDPNVLSEDGTAALGVSGFSKNGALYAYGIARSGSDWQTVYVKDVNKLENLADELKWVKFSSISWTHDHKGFFYCRYDAPSTNDAGSETHELGNQKVFYHALGSPQSDDILIYERADQSNWLFGTQVSHDGQYLLLTVHEGCAIENLVYIADLSNFDSTKPDSITFQAVYDTFLAEWSYLTNNGETFFFQTTLDAPRYRVVKFDISDPKKVDEVVPQDPGSGLISSCAVAHGNYLFVVWTMHAKDELHIYKLSGEHLRKVTEGVGSVAELQCRKEDSLVFYQLTSYLQPGALYCMDLATDNGDDGIRDGELLRSVTVPGFDPAMFQEKQVFYESKDGTRVPMFIISAKDTPLDGNRPVLLYGYGGFNISLTPAFSPFRLAFLGNLGGVVAIANIRGGGEYGKEWHDGGRKFNKQNVFDDFIAAAEYLVREKYTNTSRIAIMGGSNGGLLVTACANQRPDLFACIVAQVGVLDMLRFHKFTIGRAWTTDYGCADADKDQFEYLLKYSPLHSIPTDRNYPATLITTADHDDRVVPLHSFKFAAKLQEVARHNDAQTNPLLIRIECKAGHGAGKPTAKIIEETADIYAFIARCLGMQWQDLAGPK
eukprot:TRINITY_DN2440_c0_g1::TRINITY_DN2440_c0_g1_i2::g.8868::m.8868 TRINITY_DN2440_c0_g1::TRINITY_DN2440_c0_g1_i2::g.8868  ORF type:complete len:735 (+),score=192.16,sp/P48147/PPCE_HUMAN/48.95/0.0,Peptidase_S9_N/PF02897.10/6.8e-113,Peptidase_S9/PF00326.16/7.2e-72,Abhydrolase_5/PF12695.2/0.00033,Abhydrolase_3/PF07859.8/0.001,Esterase/PF00756.15/0.0016,Abhydrolase_1/PF00561.15/0.004,Peptidase_S15/PF02129.13/0.004,AXE1/PF05448.7/0.0096,Abhydrolase_6/PF12697.2/0.015,DLH/PF01738.13/0.033,BAAT_C/PF08840.6/0